MPETEPVCALCHRAEAAMDSYDAISANGMRLQGVPVCDACAAGWRPDDSHRCAMCGGLEKAPERLGNAFDAIGSRGGRLSALWVCNPCAIPLGPSQGFTGPFEDASTR